MRRNLIFYLTAWDDYIFWQRKDKKMLKRINDLIKDIQRLPFKGLGKPEPLREQLSGYWSRRINVEHRIVYKLTKDSVLIAQLRYHY